mmetsp:Transcript_149/g.558  ORF Transcript_149/g.558 Transcript_149/m.558 type:complete len:249 (-) Transcript_149:320-1066(-)
MRQRQASDLDVDVGAVSGNLAEALLPLRQDLRLLAIVTKGPRNVAQRRKRRANVVEHDRGVWERPRQVVQVGQLHGEEPGVEDEPVLLEQREAIAELGLRIHVWGRMELALLHKGVVRGVAPDAAEVRARRLTRHEQRLHLGSVLGQVCAANDAGHAAEPAVFARRKLCGRALRELDLAKRGHPRGVGVLTEERVRCDKDAVSDVVASPDAIVHQLVRHVVLLLRNAKQVEARELTHVPQVVVRVNDL